MIKKYTPEEYKNFIYDFTEEYPNFKKNIYRPIYWEKDIFNLNAKEMKEFIVDEVLINSRSLIYLDETLKILKMFYEWCVNKNIIPQSIWNDDEYSKYFFIDYMIDKMDIYVYKEDDIEDIVRKFSYNKYLFEILIRLPYEGIYLLKDICNLKISDINFQDNSIQINSRSIHISNKLSNALSNYIKEKSIYYKHYNNILDKPSYQYKDYLFKVPSNKIEDDLKYYTSINSSIRNYYKVMSKEANLQAIQLKDLFASGFVDYVYSSCNKNYNHLIKLFEPYSQMILKDNICTYAKDYGIVRWQYPWELKLRYYPYVKKWEFK